MQYPFQRTQCSDLLPAGCHSLCERKSSCGISFQQKLHLPSCVNPDAAANHFFVLKPQRTEQSNLKSTRQYFCIKVTLRSIKQYLAALFIKLPIAFTLSAHRKKKHWTEKCVICLIFNRLFSLLSEEALVYFFIELIPKGPSFDTMKLPPVEYATSIRGRLFAQEEGLMIGRTEQFDPNHCIFCV